MAKTCPVCGGKMYSKCKAQDGNICSVCAYLNPNYQLESIETLLRYRTLMQNQNNNRAAIFRKTAILKSLMSESVVIDQTNKLFYIGKENTLNPTYYSFDEIMEYHFEQVGGKTITKSKGGIGRAVVGGALFGGVGAIVGATTSKKETKTVGGTNLLKITIKTIPSEKIIAIANPPTGLLPFLDSCIGETESIEDFIICQKCGEQNEEANNFCKKCANPLKTELDKI